ncbi:hypothetical protein HZC53_03915 [Candidatus Uhrbacteria bacterium]|nr:hypothetical protein [Candidatus Uhrbacteria bacterium]
MEPGFKQALKEVRRQAIRKPGAEDATESYLRFYDELGLEWIAERRGLKPENVRQILALQKEKQRIIEWLESRLKGIDAKEQEFEPGARRIKFNGQYYVWEKSDGTSEPVSLGALLTDGIWDVEYVLDSETVPRSVRKKYFIEKAKRLLRRELDRQIAIDKQQSDMTNPRFKGGYNGLIKDREGMSQQGHLAERMVYSFLRKLSLDGQLPFEIETSNVYEDIELSSDFLIRVKLRRRGVAVEGSEDDKMIGIQFTIASRRARKLKKLQEAKIRALQSGSRIEDIVLVKVPLKRLADIFAAWSENKPPGGPDALWDAATKKKILKGLLKGMFTGEEIDGMCEQVTPQNPFK